MIKKILSIFIVLLVSTVSFSQNKFDPESLLKQKPAKAQLVNDYTGTLTAEQQYALENKLVAFYDSTSTQIAVVIIPSLNGYDASDFNTKLGRAWGIGTEEFNNGVVLLIAKDDRKLNIATGYGVEGALPDITSKHIIDEFIVPNFKGNDYYRGIEEGTDAIIRAVKGEYTIPPKKKNKGGGLGRIIFIIIMIIIISIISGGKGKGGSFMSRGGLTAMALGSLLGSSGRGGGWSGGGGSSGGFGGFGGGSFGGGGASGSW